MSALKELKEALKATGMDDDQIQAMLDKAGKERREKAKEERERAKADREAARQAEEKARKALEASMDKITDLVKRAGIEPGSQITIQVPESGQIKIVGPRKIRQGGNGGRNGTPNLTKERFDEIRKALKNAKPGKPSDGKIVVGKVEMTAKEACQAGLILAKLDGEENPAGKAVLARFPGIRKNTLNSHVQKYKEGNGDSLLSKFLSDYKAKK